MDAAEDANVGSAVTKRPSGLMRRTKRENDVNALARPSTSPFRLASKAYVTYVSKGTSNGATEAKQPD